MKFLAIISSNIASVNFFFLLLGTIITSFHYVPWVPYFLLFPSGLLSFCASGWISFADLFLAPQFFLQYLNIMLCSLIEIWIYFYFSIIGFQCFFFVVPSSLLKFFIWRICFLNELCMYIMNIWTHMYLVFLYKNCFSLAFGQGLPFCVSVGFFFFECQCCLWKMI